MNHDSWCIMNHDGLPQIPPHKFKVFITTLVQFFLEIFIFSTSFFGKSIKNAIDWYVSLYFWRDQKCNGIFLIFFLEKCQLLGNAWAKFKTKYIGTLYDKRAFFWYHKIKKNTWLKFWYFTSETGTYITKNYLFLCIKWKKPSKKHFSCIFEIF